MNISPIGSTSRDNCIIEMLDEVKRMVSHFSRKWPMARIPSQDSHIGP
jgi:hypothetical protein